MKIAKPILAVMIFTFLISSCKNQTTPDIKTVDTETISKTLDPNATYAKVEFSIDGMTCAMGCAKTIEKKMANMEGVKTAKVDFDKRLAMVEYDVAKVTPNSLEATVSKAGSMYKVKDIKTVEEFGKSEASKKVKCPKDCCKNMSEEERKRCDKECKKACNKAKKV